LLIAVLKCSTMVAMFIMIDLWVGQIKRPLTSYLIVNAIWVIAGAMGIVGYDELARGGQLKVRRTMKKWFIILLIAPVIIPITGLILYWRLRWELPALSWGDQYVFIPLWTLLVVTFPIALFLNRNQNKSTQQRTSADES
ncbi:MAG: hypothetical protein ABSC76_17150, partial [Terracidiphilus sp.]